MVSFQRMKDDLDDLGVQVAQKLPAVSRAGCVCIGVVLLAVLLGIAFAIGYSARGNGARDSAGRAEALLQYGGENASVHYVFVSNGSSSCPDLTGDRLITTMKRGQSFEGLVVNLACRGDYNAYPNQARNKYRYIHCSSPARVAQLVERLPFKSDGPRFESRAGTWPCSGCGDVKSDNKLGCG